MMKTAAEAQVGDVLVFRPDPEALTVDYLPTVYRRVEGIEEMTMRRDPGVLVSLLFIRPRSMGTWRHFDADEKIEVTTEIECSCSINPDGLVIA